MVSPGCSTFKILQHAGEISEDREVSAPSSRDQLKNKLRSSLHKDGHSSSLEFTLLNSRIQLETLWHFLGSEMKVAAYTDSPVFCLAFKKLDFIEAHK